MSRPWLRRRLRFTLRTALIGVVLLSLPLAYYAQARRERDAETAAIAQIPRLPPPPAEPTAVAWTTPPQPVSFSIFL